MKSPGQILVEMTGAPGTGKSAITTLLNEHYERSGRRMLHKNEIRRALVQSRLMLRPFAGLLAKETGPLSKHVHRVFREHFLECFQRDFPQAWRAYQERMIALGNEKIPALPLYRHWIESTIERYLSLRVMVKQVPLFFWEEGIAHRTMNLFVHPGLRFDRESTKDFLRSWAFPDVIVHMKANADISRARVCSRGLPVRLEGRTPKEVQQFLVDSAEVGQMIADEGRRRLLTVVEVENSYESIGQLKASPEFSQLCSGPW